MIKIVFFLLLFVACTQGAIYIFLSLCVWEGVYDTGTQCDVLGGNTLKCIFPNNVNSTRTDFAAYFYPDDNNYPELLIDCGWVDDRLQCIQKKGFRCMRPVSNIAEIRLHTRFAVKAGKFGCIAQGVSHEDAKLCQYTRSQPEENDESLHEEEKNYRREWVRKSLYKSLTKSQFIEDTPNSHLYPFDKDLPPTIVVSVFGAFLVVLFVLNCLLRYNSLIHKNICSSNSQNSDGGRVYGKPRWTYFSTFCI